MIGSCVAMTMPLDFATDSFWGWQRDQAGQDLEVLHWLLLSLFGDRRFELEVSIEIVIPVCRHSIGEG